MEELFDLTKFDSYKEDNRREVKKAEGGLPIAEIGKEIITVPDYRLRQC